MSGHMVAVEHEGSRLFYMVNCENRDEAVAATERHSGVKGAQALTPLSDDTLKHFDVSIGEVWPYLTTDRTGETVFSNG